ncbi:MAG: hypothetical protein ACT4OS_01680 [Acidimicrobiales bacterium]
MSEDPATTDLASDSPPERSARDTPSESASLVIGDEQFRASADRPFVFGRADAENVVGLDPRDMGISAVAGSVECSWGVWWVVNQSTKRPLLIEHPGGPAQVRLSPGRRHAVTSDQLTILVPGIILTHVIDLVPPESYRSGLRGGGARLTTGTLTTETPVISERERDALTAVAAGYLASFPHRRQHPNTYAEAAKLLGPDWSSDMVRKAVERVRNRFAAKHSVYFEGPQANYDLCAHLIGSGLLAGNDLARLQRSH